MRGDDAAGMVTPGGHLGRPSISCGPDHDPYVFGEIAANHARNDICHGRRAGLRWATGFGRRDPRAIVRGGAFSGPEPAVPRPRRRRAGRRHSSEGGGSAMGLSVTGGRGAGTRIVRGRLSARRALILTKSRGQGILSRPHAGANANGSVDRSALAEDERSNGAGRPDLVEFGATAMTDPRSRAWPGGTLGETLAASGRDSPQLDLAAVPAYEDARPCGERRGLDAAP